MLWYAENYYRTLSKLVGHFILPIAALASWPIHIWTNSQIACDSVQVQMSILSIAPMTLLKEAPLMDKTPLQSLLVRQHWQTNRTMDLIY